MFISTTIICKNCGNSKILMFTLLTPETSTRTLALGRCADCTRPLGTVDASVLVTNHTCETETAEIVQFVSMPTENAS